MAAVVWLFCLGAVPAVAQIQYNDVALNKGVEQTHGNAQYGGGVSFYDFDGDGWDDLTFATEKNKQLYFFRNRGGQFERVFLTGIENQAEAKQVIWVDYDADGDNDLLVTGNRSKTHLYQNDGTLTFTDVTVAAGIVSDPIMPTYGAAWADVDNDGWLDLHLSNYNDTQNVYTGTNYRDYLYHNNGDGTFTDITIAAGMADTVNQLAFCSGFLDYDKDGWVDLYNIQDMTYENVLYRNNGNGSFSDVSIATGTDLVICGMGIAAGDFNNTGYLDMYVSNATGGNKLLRNDGNGGFTEMADSAGVGFYGIGWAVNFLDADNDRDLDIYATGSFPGTLFNSSAFYENTGNGQFTEHNGSGFEGDTLRSYSNAIGDFNQDGRPDIVVNNILNINANLWENHCAAGNWVKLDLEGTQSNLLGIGSWIEVYTAAGVYYRYTQCGSGYLGQNSQYEILGLGTATAADSIIIRWPSGTVDVLVNVQANQQIHQVEGGNSLPAPVIRPDRSAFLCTGDTMLLNTGNYSSYLWSTGDTTASISVTTSGTYGLTVTNQWGQQASTVLTLTDMAAPVPIIAAVTPIACHGKTSGA
ncbi:MAG: CRTAC1 family protein, partial [Bacteroidota bacterium]